MQTAVSKGSFSRHGDTFDASNEQDSIVGKSHESLHRPRITRSSINNYNKVSHGHNPKVVEKFFAELTEQRQSIDSSYMMIEISDVDISGQHSRAATALGAGNPKINHSMSLKAPAHAQGRYGNNASRPYPQGIVASARRELDEL